MMVALFVIGAFIPRTFLRTARVFCAESLSLDFFTSIVLIMSCLTWVWLSSKENKNKFQALAHMDSLTNIYNRYGFDELAEKMIAKNPKSHFVVALLDIDDFKFINDIYGHAYGDKA